MMGLGLTLRLALKCEVCLRTISDPQVEATAIEVKIFGAMSYAVCPCCGQAVPKHERKAYRRRADKWLKENRSATVEGSEGSGP